MVDNQRGTQGQVGYNHLISNKGEWNCCTLIILFCRMWYNGSQPMMAKPMKTLELHHPVTQFLILTFINVCGYMYQCDKATTKNHTCEVKQYHISSWLNCPIK